MHKFSPVFGGDFGQCAGAGRSGIYVCIFVCDRPMRDSFLYFPFHFSFAPSSFFLPRPNFERECRGRGKIAAVCLTVLRS